MAITILSNSPLQDNGDYYINNSDFKADLFFTSSTASYNYMLLRYDGTETKVISSGQLTGFIDSTYKYRFSFNNYIKINNQDDITFTLIDGYNSLKFEGYNSSTLTLCISTSTIITSNIAAGHLVKDAYGEVRLVGSVDDLICDKLFQFKFIDRTSGDNILIESNLVGSNYIPVTIYSGSITYNNGSSTTISKGSKDYTVVLINPGVTSTTITCTYFNKTVLTSCINYTKYYF
jgi:hypothetical protein